MRYCVYFCHSIVQLPPPRGLSQDGVELAYSEFIQTLFNFTRLPDKLLWRWNLVWLSYSKRRVVLTQRSLPTGAKEFQWKALRRQFRNQGKNTYTNWSGCVGGYNYANGDYLNPETTLPLMDCGISGWSWMYCRAIGEWAQTALQQARVYQKMARTSNRVLLNELMFNASASYLQWQLYF